MEDERITAWFARVATSPGTGGMAGQLLGPSVRVVRVGPQFDVVVIDPAVGREASALLAATGSLGPVVATELGRLSFLIQPDSGEQWHGLVAACGLESVVKMRFLSTGSFLWIPTPRPVCPPHVPAAWWLANPEIENTDVYLTDGARLGLAIDTAARAPSRPAADPLGLSPPLAP